MELSGPQDVTTRVASGNLDMEPPYRFVRAGGVKDVFLCNSGGQPFGINQFKPQDNQHATIATGGHSKITFGQSLGVGAFIGSGASGFAILATSGYIGGKIIMAADSGVVGECIILHTRGEV